MECGHHHATAAVIRANTHHEGFAVSLPSGEGRARARSRCETDETRALSQSDNPVLMWAHD